MRSTWGARRVRASALMLGVGGPGSAARQSDRRASRCSASPTCQHGRRPTDRDSRGRCALTASRRSRCDVTRPRRMHAAGRPRRRENGSGVHPLARDATATLRLLAAMLLTVGLAACGSGSSSPSAAVATAPTAASSATPVGASPSQPRGLFCFAVGARGAGSARLRRISRHWAWLCRRHLGWRGCCVQPRVRAGPSLNRCVDYARDGVRGCLGRQAVHGRRRPAARRRPEALARR